MKGKPNQNYTIKALTMRTWPAYERLVTKHGGVWGGCWCTYFHKKPIDHEKGAENNRCLKEKWVKEEKTHAALVFQGEECLAWCQFGSPGELPKIYHKKEVLSKTTLPDWRITCFFVDRDYRRKGLSVLALRGALGLIKEMGGGTVESYPQDTNGKKVASSFLYNATKQIFEQVGFKHINSKGKNHCIMRLEV